MRRLLSFMLLFCFCVGSFSGCQGKQFFSSVPVSCKVQEPGGGEAEITDAALLTQLTDLVFSCDILKGAIPSGQKGYLFSFRLEDGTEETLTLFLMKDSFLIMDSQGMVGTSEKVGLAREILSNPAFDSWYRASPVPRFFLDEKEITEYASVSGKAVFTRPDGSQLICSLEEAGKEEGIVLDQASQRFSFSFQSQANEVEVVLSQGDSILFSGNLQDFSSYLPNCNGDYHLTVEAKWKNAECYRTMTYGLPVSYQLAPSVTLVSDTVSQGEVITFYVRNEDNQALDVTSNLNHKVHKFVEDGVSVILIPTSYMTEIGSYQVGITGETIQQQYTIQVTETVFPEQRLYVEESITSGTVDSNDANTEYNLAAQKAKEVFEPQQYWSEPFLQPVEGEVTAEYGMTRYVNDVPSTRHAAVDFAAAENTPVAASNSGRVVLAEFLQLTGNTVVMEHGYGIKTWYFHMNELLVAEGDQIQRGDAIGLVGSTGFSTGPHLHFAVTVNNIYVSPWFVLGNKLVDTQYRGN